MPKRTVPVTSDTCTVVGCDRPYSAKGYCHTHYYRKKREQTGPIEWYPAGFTEAPNEITIARFKSFGWTETESGCWEWNGCRNRHGYGWLRLLKESGQYGKSRMLMAHRLSHMIYNGPIPTGFVILHACDNPPCVNPAHLSAGTLSENIKDMWRKGRNSREQLKEMSAASREAVRKVSEEDVREMRSLYAEGGFTQAELGERYGISQSQVGAIIRRKRWAHVA